MKKRCFVFIGSILFLMYLIKTPILFDEYTMGRFILWSLLSFYGVWFILPKRSKIDLNLMDATILAFYGINLLSVSWAKNFGEAIFTTQNSLLFFLGYYLFRHILAEGKPQWAFVARVILTLSLFVCGLTIYQLIQTFLSEGLGGKSIYEVVGMSGHKNLLASHLYLLFCFNVFFAFEKKQHFLFYGLLGIQVLLILLLRSRAVYLGLSGFIVICLISYLYSNSILRKLVLLRVLPFIFLIAILGSLLIGKAGVGKEYSRYLNPSTYVESATGTERLFVWYKTVNLIKERPLLGYGSGNWKLWFPSKNISGGYRLQEDDIVFTRVHNDFLEVWAEVGIVGILLYLSIFILAILAVAQKIFYTKLLRQNIVLIAAIVGYLIIAFFDFPKERAEHQILLSLLIAFCVVKNTQFFKNRKIYYSFSKKNRKKWLGILTIFLLINVPLGYYRTLADKCSEQIIIGMGLRNTKLIQDQVQKGNSIWCNVNIMMIPFKWYEGLSYYWEEKFEQAEISLAEAYELNPYNFNVLNNYGSTLVQLKKYEKSVPLFLQALEINPKFEEGMFNLAFAYFQLEKYDLALEWVQKVQINQEKKKVFLDQIQSAK